MVNYIRGVDISVVQGTVDFAAIKASGIDFVICRSGVGNSGIDNLYAKNVAAAKAAGLKVAAYHFIYPLPPLASQPLRDPVKQAQFHFNAAQGELACIDCEWPAPQDFAKWGCTPAQLNQWMLAYLAEYTRLGGGKKPLVYTYPYWAATINFSPEFAQYDLWIASYEPKPAIPKPWTDWVLWQYSGGGIHLPNGAPVDGDYAKDLSLWDAVVPTPDPQPVPDPTATPITPAPSPPTPVPTKNLWGVISDLFDNLLKRG